MMTNDRDDEEDFTNRDRLVGELHYACKWISDEAFEYVLHVAKSIAAERAVRVQENLGPRDLCVITGERTAIIRRIWQYNGRMFLSSTYCRPETGNWMCVEKNSDKFGTSWRESLEMSYQQKLKEVRAASAQEMN